MSTRTGTVCRTTMVFNAENGGFGGDRPECWRLSANCANRGGHARCSYTDADLNSGNVIMTVPRWLQDSAPSPN